MATKYRLTGDEAALLVEGLDALARENIRMAQDARRLGYGPQAADFERKGRDATALGALAKSVEIERITVRY
jgi:hypothetical protein